MKTTSTSRTIRRWLSPLLCCGMLATLPACQTLSKFAPPKLVAATGSRFQQEQTAPTEPQDEITAHVRSSAVPVAEQAAWNPSAQAGGPVPVQYAGPLPNSPVLPHPVTLPSGAFTGQRQAAWGNGGFPNSFPKGRHGRGKCACCGDPGPFAFSDDEEAPTEPWAPPGIARPWPSDEYFCDGGDLNDDVGVRNDWTVLGLDPEDTIAHYDTLDGKTEITPSNKVCIYAPRFAAVRKVINPIAHEGHERMAGVALPTRLSEQALLGQPTTAIQPEQVVANQALDPAVVFRERTRGVGIDNVDALHLAREAFLPYENLKLIEAGVYEQGEKPRLAQATLAALVWQSNQAPVVIIDDVMAKEDSGLAKPQEIFVYDTPGARLRICKVADKSEAQVGDIIHFTLRFDNVGDQKVGNVTIIDHLAPRLEYISGTGQCSKKAEFKKEEKPDTLVLRWEITEPLAVGDGGIIRFQCRVR